VSKRTNQRLTYVFIIFGAIAIIINSIAVNSSFGGDWTTVNAGYIGTIPYLFLMALGFYFAIKGKSGFLGTSLIFGVTGIVNAGLFNHLNTAEIWIDAYVDATTTITDIMIIVVILWVIFGFILGALKR